MKQGYIYKIENNLNGKIYIGQTIQKPQYRWNRHCKSDQYIGRAIRKHGKENFIFSIIEESDKENLNDLEVNYIKENNCMSPNGYNLTSGGSKNTIISEETKEKMRYYSGKNHNMYGNKRPEEVKEKISKTLTGKKVSLETKRKKGKKVLCVETREIFYTAVEAALFIGLKSNSHIVECCKGKRKTAGKFHWEYA